MCVMTGDQVPFVFHGPPIAGTLRSSWYHHHGRLPSRSADGTRHVVLIQILALEDRISFLVLGSVDQSPTYAVLEAVLVM